jgi:hypothetical protein
VLVGIFPGNGFKKTATPLAQRDSGVNAELQDNLTSYQNYQNHENAVAVLL